MAVKKTYKPQEIKVSATAIAKSPTPMYDKDISPTLWGLVLLEGVAKWSTNSAIISGAVAIWENSTADSTISTADYLTFTDSSGRYAITVPAQQKLAIKVYS